ncbi:MAG: AAA family ATPase [bacterium]|nr:MAG: AAA family ATPase [bacterium]
MDERWPKILLTGRPGCGKTTLIRRVVEYLQVPVKGFYTEEVRGADRRRTGFDVITLDGRRGPLARTGVRGPRVGRYGVDLAFLEAEALPELVPVPGVLTVIDEIGKMECISAAFRKAVLEAMESGSGLLGTVARGGHPFIEVVLGRGDIRFIEVTEKNRDALPLEIADLFRVCGRGI